MGGGAIWFAGLVVPCLVRLLVGGWHVGWLVEWLVCCVVVCSGGWLVVGFVGCFDFWMVGWLNGWVFGCLVCRVV